MELNHKKKKQKNKKTKKKWKKQRKIVHLFCFRHFSEILEFNSLEMT